MSSLEYSNHSRCFMLRAISRKIRIIQCCWKAYYCLSNLHVQKSQQTLIVSAPEAWWRWRRRQGREALTNDYCFVLTNGMGLKSVVYGVVRVLASFPPLNSYFIDRKIVIEWPVLVMEVRGTVVSQVFLRNKEELYWILFSPSQYYFFFIFMLCDYHVWGVFCWLLENRLEIYVLKNLRRI